MSELEQAIARLKDGHYNSDRASAENPGGLGAGGHVPNFPAALKDFGLAAEAAGGAASTAVEAGPVAAAARDEAVASASTAVDAAATSVAARDVAVPAASTAVDAAATSVAARDVAVPAALSAVDSASVASEKSDQAVAAAATASQKAEDVAFLADVLENIEWMQEFLPDLAGLQTLVNSKLPADEKGVPGGVATLDEERVVPVDQLPPHAPPGLEPAEIKTEIFSAAPRGIYLVAPGVTVTLPGSSGPDGHRIILRSSGGAPGDIITPIQIAGAAINGGVSQMRHAGLQYDLAWVEAASAYDLILSGIWEQPLFISPAGQAVIDAMDTTPPVDRQARIGILVNALEASGVWSKLDRLWVMAAHDSQAARLDWKSPATSGRMLSTVNSPTYAADQGYTGNATNMRLNTHFTPDTDGVHFTLNSASFGVWVRTAGSDGNQAHMGVFQTSPSARYCRINKGLSSGANDAGQINSANTSTNFTPVGRRTGLMAVNRSGSSALQLYNNGSEVGSGTTASTALNTFPFALLAVQSGADTATNHSDSQISIAFVGASLTAQEQAALYAAIAAYMEGI